MDGRQSDICVVPKKPGNAGVDLLNVIGESGNRTIGQEQSDRSSQAEAIGQEQRLSETGRMWYDIGNG